VAGAVGSQTEDHGFHQPIGFGPEAPGGSSFGGLEQGGMEGDNDTQSRPSASGKSVTPRRLMTIVNHAPSPAFQDFPIDRILIFLLHRRNKAGISISRAERFVLIAAALLSLEQQPGDSALVHRVFRAIHTIKGSEATAGLAQLARFAHNVEEAFDLAREGRLAVSPELIDCGLKARDVIRLIVEAKVEGAKPK